MRILHVIPTLDPRAGGPPMVAIRLAAAQAILGHDPHLLCYESDTEGKQRIARETARIPALDRVQTHFLPPINPLEQLFAFKADRLLAQFVADADALHIHGVWESILLRAANHARRLSRPYLILTSGMLEPWAMRNGAVKKRSALAIGYRRMLDDATAIQFLTADEQANCRPLGLKSPGVVIPNGVFLEEIHPLPAPGAFYRQHPALAGRPFALFLGRLAEQKGVDLLVPAFQIIAQENPDLRLVVAGPDFGLLPLLRRQITDFHLADRVHLVGPVYGQDKFAAFADAACFCLPSRHEGFSLALVEALAAGLPAVISKQCHFPQIAAAGAGEIADLSPESIAAAILALVAPPRRDPAAAAARQYVSDHLTWTRIAEQTIQAYAAPPH